MLISDLFFGGGKKSGEGCLGLSRSEMWGEDEVGHWGIELGCEDSVSIVIESEVSQTRSARCFNCRGWQRYNIQSIARQYLLNKFPIFHSNMVKTQSFKLVLLFGISTFSRKS